MGFIIGLVIGVFVGLGVAGMLTSSKITDEIAINSHAYEHIIHDL